MKIEGENGKLLAKIGGQLGNLHLEKRKISIY